MSALAYRKARRPGVYGGVTDAVVHQAAACRSKPLTNARSRGLRQPSTMEAFE